MEEGSENNEILSADISDAQSGGFQTIKSMVRATVIRPCFPMIASSEKTTYAAEKHESGLHYKDRVDNTKRVRIISAVRRSPE
jgi:hypothetical protein